MMTDGAHADLQADLVETAESLPLERDTEWLPSPEQSAVRESWFDFDWPEHAIVRDDYWVREPFVHVAILRDEDTDELSYHVTEPHLDDFERYARQDLADRVRTRLLDEDFDADEAGREQFDTELRRVLAEEGQAVPPVTLRKLCYYFRRDFIRYGALDPFLSDPDIEDISCDGANVPVYVYLADYDNVETNRAFGGDALDGLVEKLAQQAGRHVSASQPLLTSILPDGSRLQLTLGTDVATRGSNFTVRKFREEPFTPAELVSLGTYSVEQMAYLWTLIEHNKSVLFVGPTASGKTTTMNAVSMFLPPTAKIVSIEETREVNLPHDNWIANVTRESDFSDGRASIETSYLLDEALHQRPTHIIVGEIRTDPEVVFTFFQAIGTGHAGFTTFHAETGRDVLRRLMHEPLSIAPELVTDLDAIAVQHLMSSGRGEVRRGRSIQEVRTETTDGTVRPRLHEIFSFDPGTESFRQVADSELLREIAQERGLSDERLREMLSRRCRVLSHMVENEITGYEESTAFLFRFARSPERVLETIEGSHEATPVQIAEATDSARITKSGADQTVSVEDGRSVDVDSADE